MADLLQTGQLAQRRPRIVALMGTNASGKSELGIRLAELFGAEIVSADSRQVFKDLDIGTGKVTGEQRQGISHHLIDLLGFNSYFSLADYQNLAYRAIDEIIDRNRLPLVVGGTGLYLRAILDGYALVDVEPDPSLRAQLDKAKTEALVEELRCLDPSALMHLDIRNRRRLLRAIEVARTGVPFGKTRCLNPRYTVLKLGLTWPKEILRHRIRNRLLKRLEEGMIEEVEKLLESGADRSWLESLGLEYRHVLWLLEGKYSSIAELQNKLEVAIWQFAKRQMAWFKREQGLTWLNSEGDYFQEAACHIRHFIEETGQQSTG